MKAFVWDCRKCDHRTRIDLPVGADVDLRCESCGWIVGDDADLAGMATTTNTERRPVARQPSTEVAARQR